MTGEITGNGTMVKREDSELVGHSALVMYTKSIALNLQIMRALVPRLLGCISDHKDNLAHAISLGLLDDSRHDAASSMGDRSVAANDNLN